MLVACAKPILSFSLTISILIVWWYTYLKISHPLAVMSGYVDLALCAVYIVLVGET